MANLDTQEGAAAAGIWRKIGTCHLLMLGPLIIWLYFQVWWLIFSSFQLVLGERHCESWIVCMSWVRPRGQAVYRRWGSHMCRVRRYSPAGLNDCAGWTAYGVVLLIFRLKSISLISIFWGYELKNTGFFPPRHARETDKQIVPSRYSKSSLV